MGKLSKNRIISLLAAICMLLVALMPLQTTQAKVMISGDMTVNVGQNCPVVISGTSRKPKWSSSNKAVATVNSKGWLNPLSPGKTTITAKIGSKSYKCKVTVTYFKDVSISVNKSNSYRKASGNVRNAFSGGQAADLALSCFGMDKSGGATTYNHPNGIATDGKRFFVCDSWNNRVLVYNALPTLASAKPALVLGQSNFTSSSCGYALNQMNWPVGVAVANGKLYVTDTHNHRVLVWNSIPTTNGQKADYAITSFGSSSDDAIIWPWAIWTDGTKMIVTNTRDGKIIFWNSVPTEKDTNADYVIQTEGTPRTIVTDGNWLLVGDHNIGGSHAGSRVWTSYPKSANDHEDFQYSLEAGQPGGCIADGKLVLLDAGKLLIYNKLPKSSAAMAKPSLTVGNGESHSSSNKYYYFGTGDYNQCVYAGGKLYVSLYNANKVAVFNGLPKKSTAKPNYALSGKVTGSTLLSNGLIMNPNVATNGKNLVAVSDFDWTLSVWKNIPDSSAVKADMVYTFDPVASPVDVQYYGKKLVVATRNSLYIWNSTPTSGQKWNSAVVGTIGTVNMQGIDAIATGGKYFFISDSKTNKVYVYDKVPNRTTKPVATIMGAHGSLASNGTLLTVSGNVASSSVGGDLCKTVTIYDLSNLKNITKQQVHEFTYKGERRTFNFATDCVITKDGKLVVADQGDNYVLIWNDYKNAVSGSEPDCVLGRGSTYYDSSMLTGNIPGRPVDTIGVTGKDSLVMPTFLAYDGNYLWVGEFKFSSRLLRFSGKL